MKKSGKKTTKRSPAKGRVRGRGRTEGRAARGAKAAPSGLQPEGPPQTKSRRGAKIAEAFDADVERLKLALEASGDGVWDWNVASGEVVFSKRWKAMLGHKEHEIEGAFHEWASRVHPEDLPGAMEVVQAFQSGEIRNYHNEFRMRCKDGTWKWILARGMMASFDRRGRPVRAIGTHVDVTRYKAARERELHNLSLVATGAPLSAILDALVLGMEAEFPQLRCAVMLPDHHTQRLLMASGPSLPAYFRDALHGMPIGPDSACPGRAVHLSQRIISKDIARDGTWRGYKTLARQAQIQACCAELIVGADGIILGALIAFYRKARVPVHAELGAFTAMAHLAGLAIERQRLDALRRESEDRYRRIVETAEEGIWTVDADVRTTYVNRKMAEMLGYAPAEMMGVPASEFMDEEGRRILQQNLLRRKKGIAEQHEFRFKKRDGSDLWASLSASPIFDARGTFAGVFAMITDRTRRKLAEDALRESESRYARALEAISEGIWEWNIKTNAYYVSPRWKAMLGFAEDELPGDRQLAFFDRLHPDDLPVVRAAIEQHLRQKDRYDLEFRMRTKSGEYRWFRSRGYVLTDSNGELALLTGSTADVTDKRLAEDALRESETRFRALFEQAAVGVAVIETQTGRFLEVNQRACEIARLSRKQMLASTFMDLCHPDDNLIDLAQMERLKAGEISHFGMEKRYVLKSGEVVWMHLTVSPLWKPGEAPFTHMAVIEDISRRKEAEANYRREMEFNKALVRNTAALIMVTDTSGRVIFVNPAFTRALGYSLRDIRGKLAWEFGLMDAREASKSRTRFAKLVEGAENPPAEARLRAANGEVLVAELWGTSSRDAEGNVDRIIVTGLDITDRQRLQNEVLRISEQEHARIGHDLHDGVGQTMTGVAALIEGLEMSLEGDRRKEAERIRELVREAIQDVRRLSHGLSPAAVRNRNLGGALKLLAETVEKNFRTRCKCVIDEAVRVDDVDQQTHLFRIAQEAVNNALRHGKPNAVSITLARSGPDACQLTVADDGVGRKAGRKAAAKDDGIGMRVMQYRAELIGGDLDIKDRSAGGLKVTCRFPDLHFQGK